MKEYISRTSIKKKMASTILELGLSPMEIAAILRVIDDEPAAFAFIREKKIFTM